MRWAGRAAVVVGLLMGAVSWSGSSSASPTHATPSFDGAASADAPAVRGERTTVVAPAPAPPPSGITDPLLQTVFDLTNAERAEVGLPPLRYSTLLGQAAQAHSVSQAERNLLTHDGPNGESPGDRIAATGYRFRTWAENAAMGYRSAEHVMQGWMNSPGHRANILRASVTEIGLGLAYTPNGVPYWTQKFAAPRS